MGWCICVLLCCCVDVLVYLFAFVLVYLCFFICDVFCMACQSALLCVNESGQELRAMLINVNNIPYNNCTQTMFNLIKQLKYLV